MPGYVTILLRPTIFVRLDQSGNFKLQEGYCTDKVSQLPGLMYVSPFTLPFTPYICASYDEKFTRNGR